MSRTRQDAHAHRLTGLHEVLAPELLRYFLRRTDQPADAADLLAETFLVAWRRIRVLPTDDHDARLWMFGVANRVHRNWLRGRRRAQRLARPLRELLEHTVAGLDDSALDVRTAVATLPAGQRELLMLVYWDGLPVPDAAIALGIPTTTARGRIHRAKRALRGILADTDTNDVERPRVDNSSLPPAQLVHGRDNA